MVFLFFWGGGWGGLNLRQYFFNTIFPRQLTVLRQGKGVRAWIATSPFMAVCLCVRECERESIKSQVSLTL